VPTPYVADDNWLVEWIDLIRQHADDGFVLELGSGPGRDSGILTGNGLDVVALDISLESLLICCRVENCMPVQCDLSGELPFPDNAFNVILASLSLHYFSWDTTVGILAEVKRVLSPRGMLLMRVNATDDYNFGAGQGTMLERDFYENDTRMKRFFDEESVISMLTDFNVQAAKHQAIDRYGKVKMIWEVHAIA